MFGRFISLGGLLTASLLGGALLATAPVAVAAPAAHRASVAPCSPLAGALPAAQHACVHRGHAARGHNAFIPIAKGNVVAALTDGEVNEYTPSGTLVQTLIQNASTPTGMAFDNQGNLYVTEFGGNDILKVDAVTGAVSVFSGDATLGDGTTYDSPESIAFSPDFSRMYVSEADRNGTGGLHVLNPATGAGTAFYALPSSSGSGGTGESDWLAVRSSGSLYTTNEDAAQGVMQVDQSTGDVIQPSFIPNVPDTPYSISFDSSGNLWLADNSSLQEYDSAGSLLNTITDPSYSVVFATAYDAASGTIYVGDNSTGNVFGYNSSGTQTSLFTAAAAIDGLVVAPAPPTPCSTPSVTFGAYKLTAEDGSCLVKNGTVYTDSGAVSLNGLTITPASGTVVSVDTSPGSQQVSAADATVRIGSFRIWSGPIPATSLTGKFGLKTDSLANIGGLKFGGGIELEVSGTDGLTVTGSVKLPKRLGGAEVAVSVTMDAEHGPTAASVSAKDLFVPIGKLKVGLKALSLSYNWSADTWSGSVTVGLPTPVGAEVAASITITHGQVTKFSASVSNLNKLIGDGVFLQSIGADIVLGPPPASITGSASITAGPQIDGASAIAVNGSLGYTFSSPGDFQVAGSLVLLKGTPVSQTLANGELDYYTDGHITANGHATWSLGFVSFDANLNGWVYQTKAFSLSGSADAGIGFWHITGHGVVSSAGVAACGKPFPFGPSVGFGYRWGDGVSVFADSCDIGPYTGHASTVLRGHGIAPAMRATLPGGLPAASFAIAGPAGAPPAGTITDPLGHTLVIDPANQGAFTGSTPEYGLGVNSAGGTDYVVVNSPAGGTWTFTPNPGSVVTSVATAQGLPTPKLSAAVSGKGLHRTLSWRLARLPGQRVTFVEQSGGVDHVLASNLHAGTGRVAFIPADGPAGRRQILAIVTQGGLTRETVPVASYKAPAVASIQVIVQRSGRGKGTIRILGTSVACSSVCSVPVRAGQIVTLIPVPARGSHFTWLLGPCFGTGRCQVKVTQETSVTGRFTH